MIFQETNQTLLMLIKKFQKKTSYPKKNAFGIKECFDKYEQTDGVNKKHPKSKS